jgi:hypothetical protein
VQNFEILIKSVPETLNSSVKAFCLQKETKHRVRYMSTFLFSQTLPASQVKKGADFLILGLAITSQVKSHLIRLGPRLILTQIVLFYNKISLKLRGYLF